MKNINLEDLSYFDMKFTDGGRMAPVDFYEFPRIVWELFF